MAAKVNHFGVFPVGFRHEMWLNGAVARRLKFRPIHARSGRSNPWLKLLLASGIVLGSIYLWRSSWLGDPFWVSARAAVFGLEDSSTPGQGRPVPTTPGRALEFPLQALEVSIPYALEPATNLFKPMPPRPVQDMFETQLALVRQRISPGSIDGLNGPQTRAALRVFQAKIGLPVTGALDTNTRARLLLDVVPTVSYSVTIAD